MNQTETVCEAMQLVADITAEQALKVFNLYQKLKVLKYTVHDGIKLADGRFMDRVVILRALEQAKVSD